jgi:crossover junction endodeoxyribonuclease RusA
MIALQLPYPPSANRLWRNVPGKGTLKSKAYREWLEEATVWIATQAKGQFIGGRFCVSILADAPDRRRRDLDNLAKPCLDALTLSGVVGDDSLARKVILEWSDAEPAQPGRLNVTLRAA